MNFHGDLSLHLVRNYLYEFVDVSLIVEIHKIHAPEIQGRAFSEVAEVPQAVATQTHRAWAPEIVNKWQNPQDACSANPGRVFSEVAEAPEAAPTRLTGLGDPEPGYVDEVWVNFDTISEISMRS